MKCILIADNSPVVRHTLRRMFLEIGWDECVEASNGREAIVKAVQVKPDVIVLDVSMSLMNGITAAHLLKSIVPRAHLVFFTFFDDLLNPEAMRWAGISAIVSKSEAGKLVMKVQSLMEADKSFATSHSM